MVNFQLKSLKIFYIKLGDDGFLALAPCLKNVQRFKIREMEGDENLTIKGFKALAEGLLNSKRPVSR